MFNSYLRKRGARASGKDRYSMVLSMLSNSYNESWYVHGVQQSPSLKEFDPELGVKLSEDEKRLNYAIKKPVVPALLMLVIIFFLTSRNTTEARYIAGFGVLIIYSVLLIYPLRVIRRLNEERAALWLFLTIRALELHAEKWEISWFRYGIAARVERVARYVERIPLGFRGIAPSVRRDAIRASAAKAQALRQLEASIVIPNSLSEAELIDRLKKDLRSIVNDKWYELPEDPPAEPVHSRWLPVVQVSASVLIIGLAIFIPTLAAKAGGPVYSLVAALLISLGLALLNRAGASTGYLSEILKQDGK
jgi:hypothetical protein